VILTGVAGGIFIIVGRLYFAYVMIYNTDIFSLVGTAQYMGSRLLYATASCLLCIIVTFQLALKYLSHSDGPRNLIGARTR
jgi:hypothetical protein